MALTLNKIEVVTEFKHLQIREITDEGVYHRRVIECNKTLADDEHQDIKDRAEAEWTDEVKTAWTTHLVGQEAKLQKFILARARESE